MKIIGHRGARALSPENTIAGIEKAITHGVAYIEIDVCATKDGVAILHHDPFLTDPDGSEVIIAQTTYAELLRHKPDLAALDYAIRAVQHRCKIMIEIKPGEPTKQIVSIIKDRLQRGWRLSEFSIASYDFGALKQMKEALPGVELVVNELWSGVRACRRARKLGTKRINMYEQWLYTGYVKMLKRSGYQLAIFPANKPRWHQRKSHTDSLARIRSWRPYLYGVITDHPDIFED
ncbi:glycerophosphodiester phosphodiesterase [Candidatus Saccharibacteria bacterium]|nr:glycerophosphodiester phosphodiesterase [Candidatus Saccharibacteria bacterium]